MTESQQPKRWLESDDEWRDVAAGLAAQASTGPDAAQRARMRAALSARVEAPPIEPPEAAPEAKPRGPFTLLKLGSLLALVGMGMLWRSQSSPTPYSAPKSEHVTPQLPPVDVETVRESPVPVLEVPAAGNEPTSPLNEVDKPVRSRRSTRVVVAPTELPEASAQPANPAAELALLVRARRVLLADPLRTLALAQEHANAYPHGAFAEEREVLAIEALSRAGQKAQAAERAGRFGKDFPRSTHGARIESLFR